MECIGILIVLSLVVIVAVAIAMAASANNSPAKTVYERVAARFGCSVVGTPGEGEPQARGQGDSET